ncbi:MAG: hypothetical protein ACRD88_07275 [Terriglobia bacterium]
MALHQWLHFSAQLFPPDRVEEKLTVTLRPIPPWVCRMGLGRFARRVYSDRPSQLVLDLLCRRFRLKPHQIRWLLRRARRLYPGLFKVIYESSALTWRLREARRMGIRARLNASAAERLNAACPQIDREWRQWTGPYFRAAGGGGRTVEMPYRPLPDDKEVNLPRYVFALRYAEHCLRRRAAGSCPQIRSSK